MLEPDTIPFDQPSKWNAEFEAELVGAVVVADAVWGL
jgi:hypothetical protein